MPSSKIQERLEEHCDPIHPPGKWDTAVTNEHRMVWMRNFMDLDLVKGMKLTRSRMPVDAMDTRMRLWIFVDWAKELLVIRAGVGFKRQNGKVLCILDC